LKIINESVCEIIADAKGNIEDVLDTLGAGMPSDVKGKLGQAYTLLGGYAGDRLSRHRLSPNECSLLSKIPTKL